MFGDPNEEDKLDVKSSNGSDRSGGSNNSRAHMFKVS